MGQALVRMLGAFGLRPIWCSVRQNGVREGLNRSLWWGFGGWKRGLAD